MKLVYSPKKKFSLNRYIYAWLFANYGLTAEQIDEMERHDDRLVLAVEHWAKSVGGMSHFVVKELPDDTEYYITGEFYDQLIVGTVFLDSSLKGFRDEIITHSPVVLRTADLNQPFIYEESMGLLYVSPGSHDLVTARLLQIFLKLEFGELQSLLKQVRMTASDYFLRFFKGSCLRSSAGIKVVTNSADHLSLEVFDMLKNFEFDEIN